MADTYHKNLSESFTSGNSVHFSRLVNSDLTLSDIIKNIAKWKCKNSSRLYNEDLAPTPQSKKNWGWFEIFNDLTRFKYALKQTKWEQKIRKG